MRKITKLMFVLITSLSYFYACSDNMDNGTFYDESFSFPLFPPFDSLETDPLDSYPKPTPPIGPGQPAPIVYPPAGNCNMPLVIPVFLTELFCEDSNIAVVNPNNPPLDGQNYLAVKEGKAPLGFDNVTADKSALPKVEAISIDGGVVIGGKLYPEIRDFKFWISDEGYQSFINIKITYVPKLWSIAKNTLITEFEFQNNTPQIYDCGGIYYGYYVRHYIKVYL